jgi:hypothetical protein
MNPIHRAIDRAVVYFDGRETRAGLVARRLLGRVRPEDARLDAALVRDRRKKISSDGSVGGDLVATAWLAWELMDLGLHVGDEPVRRTVKWLLGRQDRVGAELCLPRRHACVVNEHRIGGFFSYRAPGRAIRRLVLPDGGTAVSDQGSRFLASCFALRTVLRAGQLEAEALAHAQAAGSVYPVRRTKPAAKPKPPLGILDLPLVRRHVGSLLALPKMWDSWGGLWQPTLTVSALAAIAWAPLPFRAQLPILAEHLALNQKPDGSWRNLDIIHAVDALVSVRLPQAREAVALAAPKLARLQTPKGTVGTGPHVEERTLAVLRGWLVAREYA